MKCGARRCVSEPSGRRPEGHATASDGRYLRPMSTNVDRMRVNPSGTPPPTYWRADEIPVLVAWGGATHPAIQRADTLLAESISGWR